MIKHLFAVPRLRVLFEKDLALLLGASLGIGILASLALCALVLLLAQPASAQEPPQTMRLGEAREGTLLFSTDTPGIYVPAPQVHADVAIRVTGIIARVRLTQEFRNASDQWLEGIYVFPLPENAAVDTLRMHVGDRIIEGQIQERGEAKRTYEQAKRDGKKAALTEQERPNLFTNSVANIAPHDVVVIEIEYQHTLRYDNGRMHLRFPMTMTPRYIPGSDAGRDDHGGTNTAESMPPVTDAARISPLFNTGDATLNPITLCVNVDAGFALQEVSSSSHAIDVQAPDARHAIVKFAQGRVATDRDFDLTWSAQADRAPQASIFSEPVDGDWYHLLLVVPPLDAHASVPIPREIIFVVDTSGSMFGTSIEQAKAALLTALDGLHADDRFNIIEFNSITRALFTAVQPTTWEHVNRAKKFVSDLRADGGTEMAPALRAALDDRNARGYLRQIVFLTDGSVGNEDALFKLIHDRLGNSRLFTVGIGSAPNSYFMKKAAEFGRGTFTYIGDVNDVGARMQALFAKLEAPALTNVHVTWPNDTTLESYPSRIPDLYSGEPLVLGTRSTLATGDVVITGQRNGQLWRTVLPLGDHVENSGVHALWARAKIESLSDSVRAGADAQRVREQIIDVSLRHHLVSQFTSLVAVDVTPSRPYEDELVACGVPINLPAGTHAEKFFGQLPQTATPGPMLLIGGSALWLVAFLLYWLYSEHGLRARCVRIRMDTQR